MSEYDPSPIVFVHFDPKHPTQLILPKCPHCLQKHFHGPGAENRGPDFGHRVAHCLRNKLLPTIPRKHHFELGYYLWLEVPQKPVDYEFHEPRIEALVQSEAKKREAEKELMKEMMFW